MKQSPTAISWAVSNFWVVLYVLRPFKKCVKYSSGYKYCKEVCGWVSASNEWYWRCGRAHSGEHIWKRLCTTRFPSDEPNLHFIHINTYKSGGVRCKFDCFPAIRHKNHYKNKQRNAKWPSVAWSSVEVSGQRSLRSGCIRRD